MHREELPHSCAHKKRGLVRSLLLALVVIQDSKIRELVRAVLDGVGHRVIEPESVTCAFALLANGLRPDLVMWELSASRSLETKQYQQLLQHLASEQICLITGIGESNLRRPAEQNGIKNFLEKPLTRADVEKAIRAVSLHSTDMTSREIDSCSADNEVLAECGQQEVQPSIPADMPPVPLIEELGGSDFFLAASPKMLEIHRQVKLLADIDVNVLILGESGTGKEVIARLIHRNSRRSREKFLKVNCAALPTDLLESELFGHRQGAFTGALNDRAGKFEQANRGTLLLDEIGEIGVQMQAKLLHVLQDGQFARLGAQETTKVDVRVLAATNVHMESALVEKQFREDLYYRLSVFTIKVPPLRERREEIPYLIEETVRRAPAEMTRGFAGRLPSRLMDMALQYEWRGNLRELRNFVTRTMVMRDLDAAARELEAKITVSEVDLGREIVSGDSPCAGIRTVIRDMKDKTEMRMIQNALDICGWNRRRAAQYLNISYRGLLYKIQQHRLRPGRAVEPAPASRSAQSFR